MIAPYWSDIDTRCGGDIYYRQVERDSVRDGGVFDRIREDVSHAGYSFEPTSAVIVTWEGVTPQNVLPCKDQRVSQFFSSIQQCTNLHCDKILCSYNVSPTLSFHRGTLSSLCSQPTDIKLLLYSATSPWNGTPQVQGEGQLLLVRMLVTCQMVSV